MTGSHTGVTCHQLGDPSSRCRVSVDEYHRELVARLRGLLGDELIGVYAGGSFALGDFDSYLSDLDVAAVGAAHVGQTTKQAIVEARRLRAR